MLSIHQRLHRLQLERRAVALARNKHGAGVHGDAFELQRVPRRLVQARLAVEGVRE